jgi:hypothetical protein
VLFPFWVLVQFRCSHWFFGAFFFDFDLLYLFISTRIFCLLIHTGCIMKNLWCYNFLIFYPILINDTSNKIRFRNTIAIAKIN